MILVINAGSSNVKFAIYDSTTLDYVYKEQVNSLSEFYDWLDANKDQYAIKMIGHRVVHGGKDFCAPVQITPRVIEKLKLLIPLAPLHQPYNLSAIESMLNQYPHIPQVACFDTAFHSTQLQLAREYAIPSELTSAGVIGYGFHGLSYEYIAENLHTKIGIVARKKVIVAHLGNGASMCAMDDGKSVATSMGFSAIDGLMMGTRCGNIDPGVLLYLMQQMNLSPNEISNLLYKESGLLGVSKISNDVRNLLQSNLPAAQHAIELFCFRAAAEFGRLMTILRGCDALVFTAGIGEHSIKIREKICSYLSWLGVNIKSDANNANDAIISDADSRILLVVMPTNEEIVIARQTKNVMRNEHIH